MHKLIFSLVISAAALSGCVNAGGSLSSRLKPISAATFNVADAELASTKPLVFVAYGDMRFTNPNETIASHPNARQALVAKVAGEHPAAVFINGDLPWRGIAEDYEVFKQETQIWRDQNLRIYPALGNHEFAQCAESDCLDHWWNTFPELRGHRWYSVGFGSKVLAIALDSDTSMLPESEQRVWLEDQMTRMSSSVRFVLIYLHHPPVADVQAATMASHNPRANETSLADYLGKAAANMRAKIIVSGGHIHNYERFARDGIVYLVSGGGGAKPYEVERAADDLYQDKGFPNFHYVRFELRGNRLAAEMIRIADSTAEVPTHWEVKDRFEVIAP